MNQKKFLCQKDDEPFNKIPQDSKHLKTQYE